MSTIIVIQNQRKTEYSYPPGKDLLTLLRELGFDLGAPCGGLGVCGKCRVKLQSNSKTETVLACRYVPVGDCTVFLDGDGADLSWNEAERCADFAPGRKGFGAAVDLGTTTVALSLLDLADGKCIGTASEWNRQKSFGADVITRIGYCIDTPDGLKQLSGIIRAQISDMLLGLLRKNGIEKAAVREIYLAGNTVMQHIFAGLSPASIACAPFTPESCFDDGKPVTLDGIPVYPAPCVAGYVGGDITAGLYAARIFEKSRRSLFIDVGTNGEMALGSREGFVACAVASGPAFEGAGIECGMPAAFGAINRVELTEEGLSYEVLGNCEPTGICGSGILDLVACLLELGYIDESGCLEENEDGETVFYLTEQVYLTQRDIRQLQLAKAAVRAGIRLLMAKENITFDEIDALHLAGGFGNCLRPESAVRIGMLPEEMLGKIIPCGNSSLSGAQKALLLPDERRILQKIKENCTYIELSSDPAFNECFVEEMSFPEYEMEVPL